MLVDAIIIILKVAVIFVGLLTAIAYTTYFERKVVALIQNRVGPNITGPFGLLQPVADAIKLLFKEEIMPSGANRFFSTFRADIIIRDGLYGYRGNTCRKYRDVVRQADRFTNFGY